jgi:hypothetical protein
MAKMSKTKGSAFERLVAKMILEAAGSGFTKADCFRTPQSGGHAQYKQKNDLTTSDRLCEIFPFGPEAKHRKDFRVEHVFIQEKQLISYLDQCIAACEREGNIRKPLVVVRGNGGLIYAAALERDLYDYDDELTGPKVPHLLFCHSNRSWLLIRFEDLLTALSDKSKQKAAAQTA